MNYLRKTKKTIGIGLLSLSALLLFGAQSAMAAKGFSISSAGARVTIKYDGKLVTNYILDEANKPYFWPLIGPTGKRMTRAYPMADVEGEQKDHPHHRSLWFGHQGVGGFDTWLEPASKKLEGQEKKKFEAGLGSTVHTAFSEISANRKRAVIRSSNDYIGSNGKKLMADQRSMIFSMSDGQLIIDFNITLIGKYGDIELEDKKDAGFNMRIPTSMTLKDGKGHIINSEGIRDGDTWSKRAAWVDYHGPVDGEHLGIAILNHPSSFRHPTPWHVRDYGLFTANPFGLQSLDKTSKSGAFTLKKGKRVLLRHRVIIHEGDEKAAGIAKAYKAYADQ